MGRIAGLQGLTRPLLDPKQLQGRDFPPQPRNKQTRERVPINHGVLEPQQAYYTTKLDEYRNADGHMVSHPIHFIGLRDTPMGDWDWQDPAHKVQNSITIENAGDAYDRIQRYTRYNPDSQFELYLTPGGMRAWDVGKKKQIENYSMDADFMQIDPNYIELGSNPRKLPNTTEPMSQPAFWSRISGKPGRVNDNKDFVALYLGNIAGSDSMPRPSAKRQVQNYHDEPIQRYLQMRNLDPLESAENNHDKLLSRNIGTLPKSFRQQVRERYGL